MAYRKSGPLIPSVDAFKKLGEREQVAAFRAAQKSLERAQEKGFDAYVQKRTKLLDHYQEAAGWSTAELSSLLGK